MAVINLDTDRIQKQRKFIRELYRQEIGEVGKLKDNQFIRVIQIDGENRRVKYFDDIDYLVEYTSQNTIYSTNTYYTLSTTNGQGGTEEDLINRTVLGFDFDKKDLGEDFTHENIIERFNNIGLWFHVLVDSGNGYHAYMLIDSTKDTEKVKQVTRHIANRLGADLNATKGTQLLRVPYTFNIKDKDKLKQVSIIHQYEKETVKRYNIDNLYKRFCNSERDRQQLTGNTNEPVLSNQIPPCIGNILSNGSKEKEKHNDLINIVVVLRNRGKTLEEIMVIAKKWAVENKSKDNIDYQVPYIYEKWKHKDIGCKECKHKYDCFGSLKSNFDYPKDFNLLDVTETHMKRLKPINRKGYKEMKGNDLLVYGILKNNKYGLFRNEIVKEMTYTDRKTKVTSVRLSCKTLTKALKSLYDNGYIGVTNLYGEKFYTVVQVKTSEHLKYQISYAATYECAKSRITPEELRLYSYMRYLHNKEQRENPKALKGNLFQINQEELAKDLGITQQRISKMIKNLFNEKLLTEWYRKPSKDSGFDYLVYRLNY